MLAVLDDLRGDAPYTPTRTFRSASSVLLTIPRFRRVTLGSHSFSALASGYWNALPLDLRWEANLLHFRKRLKAHFFR